MIQATLTPLQADIIPLPLGFVPCEGAKCVRVPVEFDGTGNDVVIDLTTLQASGNFAAAQTIFVNNVLNAAVVTVTCSQSLQQFQAPIAGFVYMPLLQPNPPRITLNCTAAITIEVQFTNFFLPPVVWGPTVGGGGAGGGVTSVNPADHSGAIAVGGVPQIGIAANAARKAFTVSNPLSAPEKLQMAFGNTGHYIDLAPGATYESGSIVWTGDIYLNAATNAHAYTAYEGT